MYLYIMGRGHSGSTILDILLGNSTRIESVGELLSGLSRADHQMCSCGVMVPDCATRASVASSGAPKTEIRTRSPAPSL